MALIIAPLATIVWQLIVVPTETAIEQTVDNQSRNISISIPDDGRSAQVILTGDNPIWATSTWTDFTGTIPLYSKVVYRWDPVAETMMRITSVEGTGDASFTVGRFFDKFADVDIAFREGSPPFLLETALSAEGVEAAAGVAFRVGLCLYLHNDPTPPTSDTPSPGIAVTLSSANRDAKGVAIGPGLQSHFLVVDKADKRVYSYNPSGVPTGSFALTEDNTDPEGITAEGSSVWVVDKKDKVFQYDVSGASLGSFDLAAANSDAQGITVYSGAIWVVDEKKDEVFEYDGGTGDLLSSFALDGANDDSLGITTDGSSLWVVDRGPEKVFRYTTAGVLLDSFPLASNHGKDAEGIATDGVTIWVVHKGQHVIYPYHITGLYKSSLPMNEQAPTASTLFNYWNLSTASPSSRSLLLFLRSSKARVEGDAVDKFQTWTIGPLKEPLVLRGDAYLTFFAAVKDFDQKKEGKLDIFLRDHDGAGGYAELGKASVTGNDWQGESTGFVENTVVFPGVVHTLPPGHLLEVRFIVRNPGGHDMWLAYDTTHYPATLRLSAEFRTGGVPQLFLHNFPTPPLGDTLAPGPGGILGLGDANTDSQGVAVVPGGDLYVVDNIDDTVYRYDSLGTLASSFSLTSGNQDPTGLTTDGSSIWVVDDAAGATFKGITLTLGQIATDGGWWTFTPLGSRPSARATLRA